MNFDLSSKKLWKKQRDLEAMVIRKLRRLMPNYPIECRSCSICEEKAQYSAAILGWMGVLLLCIFLINGCHEAHAEDVNMDKIAQIESSGCKFKVGDDGKSIGCWQVSKGVVKEYNDAHGEEITMQFMMDDDWNYRVANWYMNVRIPQMLKAYRLADTIENRLIAYNAGIGNVKKGRLPETTRKYLAKYRGAK